MLRTFLLSFLVFFPAILFSEVTFTITIIDSKTLQPINNEWIQLDFCNEMTILAKYTDENGVLYYNDMQPGRYIVRHEKKGYKQVLREITWPFADNSTNIIIAIEPIEPIETKTITMTIINKETNEPIKGADIKLNSGSAFYGNTDSDGKIEISDISIGTYDLYIYAFGVGPEVYDILEINSKTGNEIEYFVKPWGSDDITFNCIDIETNKAIEGAKVELYELGFDNDNIEYTNNEGNAIFKQVYIELFSFYVDAQGYAQVGFAERKKFQGFSEQIKLNPNYKELEINVLDISGQPLSNARVEILQGTEWGPGLFYLTETTNDEGIAKFRLTEDEYNINIIGENYITNGTKVKLKENTKVDLQVSDYPNGGLFKVCNFDDKPLYNVFYQLKSASNKNFIITGFSESDGYIRCEVPEGEYTLTLIKNGVEIIDIVNIDEYSYTSYLFDNQIYTNYYKLGIEATNDGVAIENAEITIDGRNLITNSEGAVNLFIKEGNYSLVIEKEGFEKFESSIEAIKDEVFTLELQIANNQETTGENPETKIYSTINNSLDIFPNPATDYFTVQTVENNANMLIYNALGQIVFTGKLSQKENTIDLSNYNTGIYNIQIITKNNKFKKKLLIIR